MNDVRREILERELLAQPVRGLQYMLRRLSEVYEFLPQLATDGIFGERTLEAVMLFQREFHPPVTGVVDRGTWNAIWAMWNRLERQISAARTLRAFPSEGARVEPGDEEEYLILPQTMFQVLARHLKATDTTAMTLAMDNHMTLVCFALADPQNILRVVRGEKIGTIVKED